MEFFSWSKLPITVEFNEGKELFASGGFRNAYKTTTNHPQFPFLCGAGWGRTRSSLVDVDFISLEVLTPMEMCYFGNPSSCHAHQENEQN